MTDLPEALPILEHNTEATFGPPRDDDNHGGDGDEAEESCRPALSLPTGGEAKRPEVRQLCWGDSVDAGQVADVAAEAAAAAATTTTAVDGEGPRWQGFDMIVVREGRTSHGELHGALFESYVCEENIYVEVSHLRSVSLFFFSFQVQDSTLCSNYCSIRLQGNWNRERTTQSLALRGGDGGP